MYECLLCNELDIQSPDETVEESLITILDMYFKGLIVKEHMREELMLLFNEGYRLGFITATATRIEEDIETLKYITNKWNE